MKPKIKSDGFLGVALPRLVRFFSSFIGSQLRGCWSLLRWPYRLLSRLHNGTCCNNPMQPESLAQTDERSHARLELQMIDDSLAPEMILSTNIDSDTSALDQPEGNERENKRSQVGEARHLFALMRENDHSLHGSPHRRMRLLGLERETGNHQEPCGLENS